MPKQKTPAKLTRPKTTIDPCVICMDAPKNKANINCCKHHFCRKCIVKWAEKENTCPLCKKAFTQVKTAKSCKKIKEKRQRPDDIETRSVNISMLNDCVIEFIEDDNFKMSLASMYLSSNPDPVVAFIANHIRNVLINDRFRQHVRDTAPPLAFLQYQCARHCIEAIFLDAPGTEDNPISITS